MKFYSNLTDKELNSILEDFQKTVIKPVRCNQCEGVFCYMESGNIADRKPFEDCNEHIDAEEV